MLFRTLQLILYLVLLSASTTASSDEEAVALLKRVDELYRSSSSIATVEMQIETPHWQRSMQLKSWTVGMDDTFIRILSPKKDRGVATLKKGRDMWNYFPKINKVIKVPPSMMMGSWMGSDFTNDDLVREVSLVEEYHVEMTTHGDTYHLVLKPKRETVTVWARIEIDVLIDELIPLRQVYFDEKGRKVRTMSFSDVREFSGKRLASTMVMVPHNKEGQRTIIRYLDIEFDVDFDRSIFSLRHLQSRFR